MLILVNELYEQSKSFKAVKLDKFIVVIMLLLKLKDSNDVFAPKIRFETFIFSQIIESVRV